jgi:hypothetical protein
VTAKRRFDFRKVMSGRTHPADAGGEEVSGSEFSVKKESAFVTALERVLIYGSTANAKLAWDLGCLVLDVHENLSSEGVGQIEQKQEALLEAVRAELGISKGAIELSRMTRTATSRAR